MSYETILFSQAGPIVTITLNRPDKYNAMSATLRAELTQAVDAVESNDEARICILRGSGPGFCAGADLTGPPPNPVSEQLINEYKPFLVRIHEGEKLYIAQVHGRAAGIGGALAMTCDLSTMAEDASIYMAFAAIALIPDGGAVRHLVHGMGRRRALEAIIEGRFIPAQDCLQYGLTNRLFPADTLAEKTEAWAADLAQRAPLAVKAAKRLVRSTPSMTYPDAFDAEAYEQDALMRSEDFQRGAMAFFTKSKAQFEGN